jgi:hypothetical protein
LWTDSSPINAGERETEGIGLVKASSKDIFILAVTPAIIHALEQDGAFYPQRHARDNSKIREKAKAYGYPSKIDHLLYPLPTPILNQS